MHVIESAWLERMQNTPVFAYRMPAETFGAVGPLWVTEATVEPLELVELGDLMALHANAGIELRIAPELLPLWDDVISSTLDFNGIRLRNATLAR